MNLKTHHYLFDEDFEFDPQVGSFIWFTPIDYGVLIPIDSQNIETINRETGDDEIKFLKELAEKTDWDAIGFYAVTPRFLGVKSYKHYKEAIVIQ